MMIALYEKNPSAFYQQNVNALSAGKTLKIPEKGVVQQVSRQEALAEFNRHNDAWKNNRSGISASESPVAKKEGGDSQLKLEAPAEATVGPNETVAPSSGQVETKKSTATQSASQQQSTPDQENAKTTSVPVDDALQTKVAALEKQMAMMQELIALKDKQLAELQNPAQTATTTPVSPTQTVPPVTPPVEAKPAPTVTPPEQPTQTRPVPSKPVQPFAPAKPIVKPPIKKAVPVSHPVTEESSSPLVWILGGLFAILLPLFGWLWWQKRKIMQETDAESMFRNYTNMRSNESTGAFTTIAKKSGTGSVSAESSFLNDFKASDFESFESFNVDHGDIDPIAEADVYLAYGRYQQAEDLIRQAIKDTPERDECKLKLLEIFHANSNKQDFENYATELAAAGKKDDKDFWKKVSELSKDICPDSELFTNTNTSSPAVFVTESEVLGENVLFDSPVVEEKTATKIVSDDAGIQGVATFDVSDNVKDAFFNAPSREEPKTEAKGGPSLELVEDEKTIENADIDLATFEDSFTDSYDNGLLDFDLGPYPGNSPDEPEAAKVATNFDSTLDSELDLPSVNKEEYEAYDFDFNLDKAETIEPIKKPTAFEAEPIQEQSAWEPDKTIDFIVENVTETEPLSDDTIDFSFDFEPSMASSSKPTYQDHDFGVSDLTDMDEIETKLDLAKAYIDMGDVDSAKDIIEQVLVKGSVEQKKAAQVLLDDLN
jgi:pilus assembly protein FimV